MSKSNTPSIRNTIVAKLSTKGGKEAIKKSLPLAVAMHMAVYGEKP